MPKIVVDTNVIVSSIIQKGFPYFIMNDIFYRTAFQALYFTGINNSVLRGFREA